MKHNTCNTSCDQKANTSKRSCYWEFVCLCKPCLSPARHQYWDGSCSQFALTIYTAHVSFRFQSLSAVEFRIRIHLVQIEASLEIASNRNGPGPALFFRGNFRQLPEESDPWNSRLCGDHEGRRSRARGSRLRSRVLPRMRTIQRSREIEHCRRFHFIRFWFHPSLSNHHSCPYLRHPLPAIIIADIHSMFATIIPRCSTHQLPLQHTCSNSNTHTAPAEA